MARRNSTPKAESKSDKFKRLAQKRMTKALSAIESVGKLSNRNSYEFTAAQISAMKGALDGSVTAALEEFSAKAVVKDRGGFEF